MWETSGRSNPTTRLSLSRAFKTIRRAKKDANAKTSLAFGRSLENVVAFKNSEDRRGASIHFTTERNALESGSVASSLNRGSTSSTGVCLEDPGDKRADLLMKSELVPQSTWSLLPRHARKFLTSSEKVLRPSKVGLSLFSTLSGFFLCPNPIDKSDIGYSKKREVLQELYRHPYVHASCKILWDVLSGKRKRKVKGSHCDIFCRKLCYLLTGMVIEKAIGDAGLASPNAYGFPAFKEGLVSIVMFCAPDTYTVFELVDWFEKVFNLILHKNKDGGYTFASNDELVAFHQENHPDKTLALLEGADTSTKKFKPERNHTEETYAEPPHILPQASQEFRRNLSASYEKYRWKTPSMPKSMWQPMRTWQLRELKSSRSLHQSDSSIDFKPSSLIDGSSTVHPEDVDNGEHSTIAVDGKEKLRNNWKNEIVSANLTAQRKRNQGVAHVATTPQQKSTWQPKFSLPSRLLDAYDSVLGDGTKLADDHNNVTFDKRLFYKKLEKNDYKYTIKTRPLPTGREILHDYTTVLGSLEMTNDVRNEKAQRKYRVSQLSHLSYMLQAPNPRREPTLPYETHSREVVALARPQRKAYSSSIPFTPTIFHVPIAETSATPVSETVGSVVSKRSEQSQQHSTATLHDKEDNYIRKALEMGARARIRKEELAEIERSLRY